MQPKKRTLASGGWYQFLNLVTVVEGKVHCRVLFSSLMKC
jgi:hypothetical protein